MANANYTVCDSRIVSDFDFFDSSDIVLSEHTHAKDRYAALVQVYHEPRGCHNECKKKHCGSVKGANKQILTSIWK